MMKRDENAKRRRLALRDKGITLSVEGGQVRRNANHEVRQGAIHRGEVNHFLAKNFAIAVEKCSFSEVPKDIATDTAKKIPLNIFQGNLISCISLS